MGLAARCCLLTIALVLACIAATPLAFALRGTNGLLAVGVAAGVCWFGAVITLPIAALFRGPSAMMYGLALSMLGRTMLPLVLGVALHFASPMLADAGMIYYLLVFYLLTLAVETVLAVASVAHDPTSQKAI